MSPSRCVAIAAVILVAALATAVPAAAAPHIGYANDLETRHDHITTPSVLAADAAQLGFDSQIVIVDWEYVQRKGQDVFDWSHYDRLYAEFAARGIRPYFEVVFTPVWAANLDEWRQFCGGTTSWRQCGYRLPPATNRMEDWKRFIQELMQRYAGWRPLGLTVWNEANSSRYWKTGPDPARYLELMKATKDGVTAAGSQAPVMTGLSPSRDTDTTLAEVFLHDLYLLGGDTVIDGIGTNLYASASTNVDDPNNWFNKYLWWMRYVKWLHSTDDPIWIVESGYKTKRASNPPSCQLGWNTEAFQADQLVRAIRHVRSMPDIGSYFIHRHRDTGPLDSCVGEEHFGLRRYDGSAKPAWGAIDRELAANPLPTEPAPEATAEEPATEPTVEEPATEPAPEPTQPKGKKSKG